MDGRSYLKEELTDIDRLRAEILEDISVNALPHVDDTEPLTKICPSTAPKQDKPNAKNHMRNVKMGKDGSSSSETRRTA